MTVYDRARKAGHLASQLYDAVGNLVGGLCSIHRDDFVSALWYLSMGGFCPDKSREAYEAWRKE